MPIVPRRNGITATAPLPGVRQSPEAPAAAFGVPGPGIDFAGPLQSVVEPMARQARQEADQLISLDADNQAAQRQSDLERQLLARKGKDALDNSDLLEEWNKSVGEIETTLKDPRQRMAFRAAMQSRTQAFSATAERHAAAEHEEFDRDTTTSGLDLRMDSALANYADPELRAKAMVESRAILQDYARRNGWSPETTQEKVQTQLSRMHSGVIERYLDAGQDIAAAEYYKQAQTQMTGKDQGRADKLLEIGSTLGEAQRQSDTIMKSAPTLTDALSQARLIQQPKVREATEGKIRQRYEDMAFADRLDRENAFGQAKDIVRQNGGDYSKVPPAVLNKLNTTQEEEVRRIGRNIRYPDHITDESKYTHLLNFASVSPAAFLDIDLRKEYGEDLSRNDMAHVEALQRKLRESQSRAETTADTRVKRGQEKVVLDAAKDATKNAANDSTFAKLGLTPPSRKVTVPQWMLDSAKVNKPYAEYLRMHGVNLDQPTATQSAPTAPKVPGAPINLGAPQTPQELKAAPAKPSVATPGTPTAPAVRLEPTRPTGTAPNTPSSGLAVPPVGTPYEKNGHTVVDTPRPDAAGHVPTHRLDQATNRQPNESWTQYENRVLGEQSKPADAAIKSELTALEPDVRAAAVTMVADAKKAGIHIEPKETFRTQARQEALFREGRAKGSKGAPVTWTLTSDHTTGRAIDFDGDPKALAWLEKNAPKYGFTTLGDLDPGHVSMPKATASAQGTK